MTVTKNILEKCLLQVTLDEIKEIEAMNYEIKACASFKKRIEKTVAKGEKKKKASALKKAIVILIAAVILSFSVMFAVSAEIREAVSDFFVFTYKKFSMVYVNDEDNTEDSFGYPQSIEQLYLPKYIKDKGYAEAYSHCGTLRALTVWENDTVAIDLSQSAIVNLHLSLNTENANLQRAYIDNKEVLFVLREGIYTVVWTDYGYLFTMSCDGISGWEEIEKIILSLSPVS